MGIIFDFDGTLVDTMPLHFDAYRRTFAEHGLELSEEQFFASIGGKASETIPKLLRGRSCTATIEQLHRRKQEIVDGLLRSATIPVLSTASLLGAFYGAVPMALASSGSRPGIDVVLERLQWQSYFDVIVTGADVTHGKPAPDLFLLAAERIAVPPADCVVFEDTDAGMAAAAAANMTAFDVRRAAPPRIQL